MSKVLQYGGVVASVILIAFGIGSIVTGINGVVTLRVLRRFGEQPDRQRATSGAPALSS